MSTTYPVWPLTTYPDSLDETNPLIRQDILNFEDRTSATDPSLYYVLANDVKNLQQSVFSVEKSLGIKPQSTYSSVDARFIALEDYTDLDARFGGSTWRDLYTAHLADGSKPAAPTIMSHLHDGSINGVAKIDLVSHVNGKLGKTNLNLIGTDPEGITGDDILLNNSTTVTVADKFNDKLDKTGGTITGTGALLTVNAPFNSRMYKELDAKDLTSTTGINTADTGAFSGVARKATSASAAGTLIDTTVAMRYADYSIGIRAKATNASITQSIGKIRVYSAGVLTKIIEIIPANFFGGTDYEMLYVPFSHKGSGNWNVRVAIDWYGASIVPAIACDLSIDSVMITPVHVTAYDME
jgi:hypothetical protein